MLNGTVSQQKSELFNCIQDKFNGVLKNLVKSIKNCNTVSRQRIHDVTSQLVGVHKLKIGHHRNLFFAL